MRALKIEDNKMKQIVKQENLETLNPEYNTKPRVYYKNLYRFNKCFIGGSVALTKNKIDDCVSGAEVKLYKDDNIIAEVKTDDFGDFKIDKLDPNSGKYKIDIKYKTNKKSLKIDLKESVFLGDIYL